MTKTLKTIGERPDLPGNPICRWRKNGYSVFWMEVSTAGNTRREESLGTADPLVAKEEFEKWCTSHADGHLGDRYKDFHRHVALPYLDYVEKGNLEDEDDGPRESAQMIRRNYEIHIQASVEGKTLHQLSDGKVWANLTRAWIGNTHVKNYSRKFANPKGPHGGVFKKKTVRNLQSTVQAMYNWAAFTNPVEERRIAAYFIPHIKLVGLSRKKRVYDIWNEEMLFTVLPMAARAYSWQMYAFYLAMLYSLQRPKWVLKLRRSHVNLGGEGVLHFETLKPGPAHAHDHKNVADIAMVPDLYAAMEIAHRQLKDVPGDPEIFGEFVKGRWVPWTRKKALVEWGRFMRAAGAVGTPYKVKHSHATLVQVDSGGREAVSADSLGQVINVSATVLRSNYTHNDAESRRGLTNRIFRPLKRPKPKLAKVGDGS